MIVKVNLQQLSLGLNNSTPVRENIIVLKFGSQIVIENKIDEISVSWDDLTDKPSIPSVNGLASEAYVNEAVSDIDLMASAGTAIGSVMIYNPSSQSDLEPVASGKDSLAFGHHDSINDVSYATEASGNYSVAIGKGAIASAEGAFALGSRVVSSGVQAYAEGAVTTASGLRSHAEGSDTIASGSHSHAEGYLNTASGDRSHAEGSNTTASGHYSHTEGHKGVAAGECSHVEGYYTKASGNYSHVQGKFNIEDTSNTYADIVGGGNSASRKNIETTDWSGNKWVKGKMSQDGTPSSDKDLTTKAYVDNAISNIDTSNVTGLATQSFVTTSIDTAIDDLATVASSGNYNDLSNKPTIPSTDGFATNSAVALLWTAVNSNEALIDALTARIVTLESTVATLQTTVSNLNEEANDYATTDYVDTSVDGLKSEIEDALDITLS